MSIEIEWWHSTGWQYYLRSSAKDIHIWCEGVGTVLQQVLQIIAII